MPKRKFSTERLYKVFRVIVIIVSAILGFVSLGYYLNYLDFDKDKELQREEQGRSEIFPSVQAPEELFDFRETHPEYNDIDDYTLVRKLAGKYSQYTELKKKVEDYYNLIREKDYQDKFEIFKTYTFRDSKKLKRISFKWAGEKPPAQNDIEKMYQRLNSYNSNIYRYRK